MTSNELRALADQFRRSWRPGRTCRVVPRQACGYLRDAAAIQEAAAKLAAPSPLGVSPCVASSSPSC